MERMMPEEPKWKQSLLMLLRAITKVKNDLEQAILKRLVAENDALAQQLRDKRHQLAELDAVHAAKRAEYGKLDMDYRELRKRISGDPQHA
jgi:cell division septum initiation protein DivIVA